MEKEMGPDLLEKGERGDDVEENEKIRGRKKKKRRRMMMISSLHSDHHHLLLLLHLLLSGVDKEMFSTETFHQALQ